MNLHKIIKITDVPQSHKYTQHLFKGGNKTDKHFRQYEKNMLTDELVEVLEGGVCYLGQQQ